MGGTSDACYVVKYGVDPWNCICIRFGLFSGPSNQDVLEEGWQRALEL